MSDPIKFELFGKEQDVMIGDCAYKIKELSAAQVAKWKNLQSKNIRTDIQGRPAGFKTLDGFESSLISLCLYDENGRLVPAQTINEWPSSTVTPLFKLCLKINGLDEDAETREGNS